MYSQCNQHLPSRRSQMLPSKLYQVAMIQKCFSVSANCTSNYQSLIFFNLLLTETQKVIIITTGLTVMALLLITAFVAVMLRRYDCINKCFKHTMWIHSCTIILCRWKNKKPENYYATNYYYDKDLIVSTIINIVFSQLRMHVCIGAGNGMVAPCRR